MRWSSWWALILPIIIFCIPFLVLANQNTIIIIGDDLSPDFLGFTEGATDTATIPNLESLAKAGIRFTNVWSNPVCSPTRAGMLTGRYSFRTGIGNAVIGATTPQLDTSEVTLAKLLQKFAPTRYATACIGKWHLHTGTPANLNNPNILGFDFYAGNFNGALPDYYQYSRVTNGVSDLVNVYATTQTVNDALAWITSVKNQKPFFLWLALNAPHLPIHLPPVNLTTVKGLSGTTQDMAANPRAYYKASIEAMDTEIGRLLLALKTQNLYDSTNIIFMGDNGSPAQVAHVSGTGRSKESIYDYGSHVPFVVAGPMVARGGRVSSALINGQDLFATIAEMSGFTRWDSLLVAQKITYDAKSFLPVLKDQVATARTWIFSELFTPVVTSNDGKSIRNQNYHLLQFDDGREAFYNLVVDPSENSNLLQSPLSPDAKIEYQFLCSELTNLLGKPRCKSVVSLLNRGLAGKSPTGPASTRLYDSQGRYLSVIIRSIIFLYRPHSLH